MTSESSISGLLRPLERGEARALRKVWETYFERLAALARQRLGGSPRRASDEDDVVLSALESFYSGVAGGRFPQLEDRNDLWRILVVITARKAQDHVLRERRQKRGGGQQTRELDEVNEGASVSPDVAQLLGQPPQPDFVAEMADECRRLLDLLDPPLREIALWKMEGHTVEEISQKLGCVPRSVERKLRLIRGKWSA